MINTKEPLTNELQEKLARLEENIRGLGSLAIGFSGGVDSSFFEERVRMHGNIARIEVPPVDIPRLAADGVREEVYDEFRKIGFLFVTLDLKGYRLGSMNATLQQKADNVQE